MKKTLTVSLLLGALLLTACGEAAVTPADGVSKSDDTAAVQPAETDAVTEGPAYPEPELPALDLNGEDFSILNGNVSTWMMISTVVSDGENGDSLNDAIFRRNHAVEEKFNLHIKEEATGSALSLAQKSVTAGDNAYDLFLVVKADALSLVLKNALVDYADIPYIQTDMPWWVQNSMSDMSIAGRVYYGISNFDTTHYDGVRTIFFNKSMVDAYDLESPYDLVRSGKWTLAKLLELGTAVSQDLDGDGKWTETDQYGYSSWSAISGETLMTGSDAPLSLQKDEDDLPYFNMNTPYYITRLEAVADLLAADGFLNPGACSENNGGVEYFKAGRILFYNEAMGNAQKLRQMELDFGIIPGPKYDEAQENYRNVGGNPYFTAVPITAPDLSMIGAVMESLAYESTKTVKVAAYDEMLWGKVSRDDASEEMLNIIYSTLCYDMPTAATYVCSTITDTYLWKNKKDFSSYFAKNEVKIQKEIDKTITAYQETYQ